MSIVKLDLYNRALDLLGEPRLAHLSQARLARYALDDAYTFVLSECLEQGMWLFAMRTVAASSTALPTPDFGFAYAYTIPADIIHTYMLFRDATTALDVNEDYVEIDGEFLTQASPLYVRYTSNGASYGNNLALWPYTFSKYVAAKLAGKVCFTVTRRSDLCDRLSMMIAEALSQTRAIDAVLSAPGQPPMNVLQRREFNEGANVREPWPFPPVVTPQEPPR